MIASIQSATAMGLLAQRVTVEVDVTQSLPAMVVVGLPDKAVQESKERVRSGIKESGFEFPIGKVVVNLAPADIQKSGTGFDIPIALGILQHQEYITSPLSETSLYIGELALDGSVRSIDNILSICLWAKDAGFHEVFIPKGNSAEASLVSGISIFAVQSLRELVDHITNKKRIEPIQPIDISKLVQHHTDESDIYDFKYVRGQGMAKRALEIAAAGGHNVLLIGQPGSGKTLLARCFPSIMPCMTPQEVIEATQVHSAAGLMHEASILITRPFRSPHHSSSHVALVGGGTKLRPGEISLAHRGVLFLDEFPEFSREAIESLRQPLEDGFVTISRASGSVQYPSRFYLIAAANPSPTGFRAGDPAGKKFGTASMKAYQARMSGPILDRIDLQVEVNKPKHEELQDEVLSESSSEIRNRVQEARNIQTRRLADIGIYTNAEMQLPHINSFCPLGDPQKEILREASEAYHLSARSYMRIIKVSRTIADLSGQSLISVEHILEALQFRGREM